MILSQADFAFIEGTVDRWNVLVVDDDEGVIGVTELVLEDLDVAGKPLNLIDVRSGTEAEQILRERNDIAVVLLDVVMESTHSGLELVETIRDDIGNQQIRILLRTGQPGYAPEAEVVRKYDIDDYLAKSELTETRLITSVTSAIRSYAHILHLDALVREYGDEINRQASDYRQLNRALEEEGPARQEGNREYRQSLRLLELTADLEAPSPVEAARSLLERRNKEPRGDWFAAPAPQPWDRAAWCAVLAGAALDDAGLLAEGWVSVRPEEHGAALAFPTHMGASDLELALSDPETTDIGFLLRLTRAAAEDNGYAMDTRIEKGGVLAVTFRKNG